MAQRDEAWFEARCGKITASRMKDVLAVSKRDGSPLKARQDYLTQLVVERLTGQPCEKTVSTIAMQHGLDMEPYAKQAYARIEVGEYCEPDFLVHPELPYLGASPDLFDPTRKVGVEIKCPWNETVHLDTLLCGMPEEHMAQVQTCMMVTGAHRWDFVSYHPSFPAEMRLYVQPIARDDAWIARAEAVVQIFNAEVNAAVAALREKYNVKAEGEWS